MCVLRGDLQYTLPSENSVLRQKGLWSPNDKGSLSNLPKAVVCASCSSPPLVEPTLLPQYLNGSLHAPTAGSSEDRNENGI